jgi:hypothetical protein
MSIPTVFHFRNIPEDDKWRRAIHEHIIYATAIVFDTREQRDATIAQIPRVGEIEHTVLSTNDNPEAAGAELAGIGKIAEERLKREIADRDEVRKSKFLDRRYAYPWLGRDDRLSVATYTTTWRIGIKPRKPRPGFHPGIYAEKQSLKAWSADGDPFAHYLRNGKPKGPWSIPVIMPWRIPWRRKSPLKAALHIHLFYPEMAKDIIRRLKRSASCPDLLISAPSEVALGEAKKHFQLLPARKIEIRVVPNAGRDIGPMLSEFSKELQDYDVIGHFHVKKSLDYENRYLIENWINFLSENMLGGKKPMIDVILHAMEQDPVLGLVYPDDPHVIGWMGNRDHAVTLMHRMKLKTDLPERFINFPVGTMFWARPQALKPLFDLNLDWSDYPEEPIPPDGTMLHAIERILPMISEQSGYRNAVTYVRGVFR